jgi:VWFA-related protein
MRPGTLLLTFHFLLSSSHIPLTAQQPVFRSNTAVVVVPVTVTDQSGRFVPGLAVDQFELTDGGVQRPISQFSAERVPVSLAILLDISGSMASDPKTRVADEARWADTRRALELLVERLNPDDEVLFAAFSDKVGLAVPWTSDHQRVTRAFNTLQPGGYTAMFDAVRLIAPAFQRAQHSRKVLLVITDGNDSLVPRLGTPPTGSLVGASRQVQVQSEIYYRQKALRDFAIGGMQRAVANSGAAVYAIGMGTGKGAFVDVQNLETLTVNSGGYVEAINDPAHITSAVARVFDELQSQYLLAFEPTHTDGKAHAILVTVRNSQLKVRARSEYVAK